MLSRIICPRWRLRLFSTIIVLLGSAQVSSATTYYLNCSTGNDSNSGTSSSSPWGTLDKVNSVTYQPGDSILLADGVTCNGTLAPQGQGTSNAYIIVSNYGTGSLPLISAGTNNEAIYLHNQNYWQINNLSTTGGVLYGVYVEADSGIISTGVQLHNLTVTNVTGTATSKYTGLVVFTGPGKMGGDFSNCLVDGVTAYQTTQWQGIAIWGSTDLLGTGCTIQNSIAHDMQGDGIVIHFETNGLIQNSVAYNTGLITSSTIGTPSAIWDYWCYSCTVQFNESYYNHTPGTYDGGDYDADNGTPNYYIQYNYGHDADGYCIATYSTGNQDHDGTVIRYNICSNNDRNTVKRIAEFNFNSASGGCDTDLQVYNNTTYYNPNLSVAGKDARIGVYDYEASICGNSFLENNIAYAAAPEMFKWQCCKGSLVVNNNDYWYTGAGSPEWINGSTVYTTLSAWYNATGWDENSIYADPLLNSPTYYAVHVAERIAGNWCRCECLRWRLYR